jgi:flagellar FliL protein
VAISAELKRGIMDMAIMTISGVLCVTVSFVIINKLSPPPTVAVPAAAGAAVVEAATPSKEAVHEPKPAGEKKKEGHGGEKSGGGGHGGGHGGGEEASSTFPLKTLVVNLAGSGDGHRFAKVTMTLQLTDVESVATVKASDAMIYDSIIKILGSYRYEDISTMDGKDRVKMDVMDRINKMIPGKPVTDVFLTEFLVQ